MLEKNEPEGSTLFPIPISMSIVIPFRQMAHNQQCVQDHVIEPPRPNVFNSLQQYYFNANLLFFIFFRFACDE